jgi:drug/metabolite transporter (DMT)-like permease
MIIYSVCFVSFGVLLIKEKLSAYTVLLGLIFGVVTALSSYYKMLALAHGPMHITMLFITSSMIIPTMSGVFFGEVFSLAKLCIVFLLLGFVYLSLGQDKERRINKKWFWYCLLSFAFQGPVGILQKVHQNSAYKEEVSGFLVVAFICALISCFVRNKGIRKDIRLSKGTVVIGLVCGGCTFAMNYINLKLSGILPSQLFFPLINGSGIILCSVVAVFLFREKLTRRQLVGLIGGIGSLIAICLVR